VPAEALDDDDAARGGRQSREGDVGAHSVHLSLLRCAETDVQRGWTMLDRGRQRTVP
jgi:hypothetical protein